MVRFYITYGLSKSASTFAWQLVKRVAIAGGLQIATLTAKSKGASTPEDFIDPVTDEKFALVEADVGDAPVVFKTHGKLTPIVVQFVNDGMAHVFVSYRDPRDMALSLLDHGARSRAKGIADFANLRTISDTVPFIQAQLKKFNVWVDSCNPLLLPYDEICFDTRTTIARIATKIGVEVDVEKIFVEFDGKKGQIGQFNKGEFRRFERELDVDTSHFFLTTFKEFYDKFLVQEENQLRSSLEHNSPVITRKGGCSDRSAIRSTLATREDILWCYRSLLARDPESDEVLDRELALGLDLNALISRFVSSSEFERESGLAAPLPLLDDRRAMSIDLKVTSGEMAALKDRVSRAWAKMSAARPYYTFLTRPEQLAAGRAAIDYLYDTGAAEVRAIEAILRTHGVRDLSSKICVEYGCSLGRLTFALAKMFRSVEAYDTRPSYLNLAEARKAAIGVDNIRFLLWDDADKKKKNRCDIFYSRLAFQQNTPPVIRQIIVSALELLYPGGVAIFHLPTYVPDYSFQVQEYLGEKESEPRVERHCLPQSAVFEAIAEAGCQILEVREDRGEVKPGWVSNIFVVKRPDLEQQTRVRAAVEIEAPRPITSTPLRHPPEPIVTALSTDQPPRNKTPDSVLFDRVRQLRWFHQIDLGSMVTPGVKPKQNAAFQASVALKDVAGKTVLDVGAWDGYFSFAAEQAGASRVLATDHFCWVGPGWGKIDGFLTAREILNSSVEYEIIDATEISRETVGTFDVVLFLGVLCHLKEPFAVLERISSCATQRLIVETETALDDLLYPAARFFPSDELNGDNTNWWAPNCSSIEGMLKVCGFKRIELVAAPWVKQTGTRGRSIFVAHRDL